eukprot:gene4819-6031_t
MRIGVPIGLAAGWRDGWLSEGLMRVTDVFLAVPQLILALALGQLLAPGIGTAMVALALTYWPFFARTVFAETRRLRGSLFVDALAGIGAHPIRILLLHVLPNAAPAVLVRATIGMGFTILTAAILGFLGVGAAPPTPDWGLAVAEARQHLPEAWWFATFPGLAIMLLVLGFNLLGDGLRDAPRMSRPVLEITQLAVELGGRDAVARILDDVSITVPAGSITGVVGESGCGKSTLLRAILGILPRNARTPRGGI